MYKVASRFEDGYEAVVAKSVGTLAEAIDLAFGIADHAGRSAAGKVGYPTQVLVYRGSHLEIAIAVIAGGITREGG